LQRCSIWGLATAVAIACVATTAQLVRAASSLTVTDTEIRVLVPLEVDGGTDRLTGAWMDAIDAAWNRGNGGGAFNYCGRAVHFVPVFKQAPKDSNADPGYHLLIVQPVQPGQSFVSTVLHDRGTLPTTTNRNGFVAENASAAEVAHEFGHYLGLADEYVLNDLNGNGVRDQGDTTRPNTAVHADAGDSLMGTLDGRVLSRLVDEALAAHGIDEELICPTEILVRGIYTTQPVTGCNGDRATIQAKVTAPKANDSFAGDGRIEISWRALNRCEHTLFGGYQEAPRSTSTLTLKADYDLRTGHIVTITTSGQHQSLFTSGKLIGSGNFIKQWPDIVQGTNVRGTLASFTVPYGEWVTGAVFRFENRSGLLGPGGSMRLSGSGTVEICPTSSAGPFAGCSTGR